MQTVHRQVSTTKQATNNVHTLYIFSGTFYVCVGLRQWWRYRLLLKVTGCDRVAWQSYLWLNTTSHHNVCNVSLVSIDNYVILLLYLTLAVSILCILTILNSNNTSQSYIYILSFTATPRYFWIPSIIHTSTQLILYYGMLDLRCPTQLIWIYHI